jgi:3-oxoacyl-[acyl-carrier-protein] synthase II
MVSPLGIGLEASWKALCAGTNAIDWITIFDASSFPTRIAAEVRDFDFDKLLEGENSYVGLGRNSQFALIASQEAVKDAGLVDGNYDPEKTGVYLGAGEGTMDFKSFFNVLFDSSPDNHVDMQKFFDGFVHSLDKMKELQQEPNIPAAHIAIRYNARGINCNTLTACAASSQATGEAMEIIRHGDADVMIAGGTHSMIHPFGIMGFNLLTAITTRNDPPDKAMRPFDLKRDGFVLGEGSSILILEELEHAKARGARIYAELIGYGSTADAYRATDSHPEGRGAIATVRRALADAQVAPEEIDYINAHGTSTVINDKVETLAVKEIFGDHAWKVPMSSIKSMLGHLIAAAGATELIVCIKAINDGIIPPTINYEYEDPECDLDYVPNVARKKQVNVVMSNSFGFGGQNVALIVRRYPWQT